MKSNFSFPLIFSTLLLLIASCSTASNEYVGKWKSQDLGTGNIMLDIQKDGELYKIHHYAVDTEGAIDTKRHRPNKTYLLPLENGVFQINPVNTISYSETDGKLYYSKWNFTKIE